MSLETTLRDTTPTDLPALDHERLQRAGRLRRTATRLLGGTAAASVLVVGGLAVVDALPTQDITRFASGAAPLDEPIGSGTEDGPADAHDASSAETGEDGRLEPDEEVLATYADLTHAEVLATLAARLGQAPRRPDDLASITTYEAAGGDRVERLRGDETAQDFPVLTVLDAEFDPKAGFETPALQPTWDQRRAGLALEALARGWTFTGVDVDAVGRTVIVFRSETSEQFVQVDPASGYTSGIVFGVGEWFDGEGGSLDESPPDAHP